MQQPRLRNWSLADKMAHWTMPEPNSGCFLWRGPVDGRGYGRTYMGGKTVKAHRAAWELVNGPIPVGMLVRHRCDNPSCVNPDHLLIGTDRDNSDDKVRRRRHSFGERNHTAKLTPGQVAAIRADARSNSAIARELGVHNATISRIRSGGLWNHPEYELAKEQP
jgi:hypothetical protein